MDAAKTKALIAQAQALRKKQHEEKVEAESGGGEWSDSCKRLFVAVVVLSMVVPSALVLYGTLFPNYPPRLSLADAAVVQRVFFGGEPALILCENSTSIAAAGPAVVALAAKLRVPAHRLDCSAQLPGSERNTFERMGLERWNPTAFLVANGRKRGEQFAPDFTDARKHAKLAKGLELRVKARHTRVDNTRDLHACIDNSAEACVLVYNSKPKEAGVAEIAPLVAAHRSFTFALLDANVRAFRAPTVPLIDGLLQEEVAAAKAGAAAEGGKGSVLIVARRVAPALAGGGSANGLVTFKAAAGAAVRGSDAAAALAGQKAATDLLRTLSDEAAAKVKAGASAADVAIEASFERDERLQALGAVLVSKDSLAIDRAPVKATPTPPPAEGAAAAAEPPARSAAEEKQARESEARRRMDEEERNSGHLAELVDEDEAAAAAGSGAAAGDEDDAGGVDLDL